VTVDDAETWATAWTAEWPFKAADTRLHGVDCHEGNYAIEYFLRGARAEERRTPGQNRCTLPGSHAIGPAGWFEPSGLNST
jgi:hypothetical protein